MAGARPDSGGSPRFPLAARALRGAMPAASRGAAVRAGSGVESAARTVPTTRAPRNWALYLFLILLPLQNITAGYLPNIGGGFNFPWGWVKLTPACVRSLRSRVMPVRSAWLS